MNVHYFFSRPLARLTNRPPVLDSDPGMPLVWHRVPEYRVTWKFIRSHSMTHQAVFLPMTLPFLVRGALASPYLERMVNFPVEELPAGPGLSEFCSKIIISVFLVLAGGVFAGWAWMVTNAIWFDLSTLDWRLDLWDWMNCTFACWLHHRRTWEKREMLRKVWIAD